MNWLKKLFMPSAKTLAGVSAKGITKGVNGCGTTTRDKIAKIAAIGETASKVSGELMAMLADGKIDETETGRIAKMLEPVFQRVVDAL